MNENKPNSEEKTEREGAEKPSDGLWSITYKDGVPVAKEGITPDKRLDPNTPLGLLQFLTTLPKGEAPETVDDNVTTFAEMSEAERTKWRDIIMGKDPESTMISDADRIKKMIVPWFEKCDPDGNEKELVEQLDQINFMVEVSPNVSGFYHYNGIKAISKLFKSKHAKVREATALCIATCTQNNIEVQKYLLKIKALRSFFAVLDRESDPKAAYKLLLLVGAYFRGFMPGLAELLEMGGLNALVWYAIQRKPTETNEKIFRRTSHLLLEIVETLPGAPEECVAALGKDPLPAPTVKRISEFLELAVKDSGALDLEPFCAFVEATQKLPLLAKSTKHMQKLAKQARPPE